MKTLGRELDADVLNSLDDAVVGSLVAFDGLVGPSTMVRSMARASDTGCWRSAMRDSIAQPALERNPEAVCLHLPWRK